MRGSTPVGDLGSVYGSTVTGGHGVRFLPPCHCSVGLRMFSLLKVRPGRRGRRTDVSLVGTIIGVHSAGAPRRVRRLRHTSIVKCGVRAATVGLIHPKVARGCMTKRMDKVTRSCKTVIDFPAVFDRRKRVRRNCPSVGLLRRKELTLYSTNTRAVGGCYSSRAHAVPIDNGFDRHRLRVCSVMRTYRSCTLRITGPNIG